MHYFCGTRLSPHYVTVSTITSTALPKSHLVKLSCLQEENKNTSDHRRRDLVAPLAALVLNGTETP